MKILLIFLWTLSSFSGWTQSTKKLSNTDLQKAKSMYVAMMQSNTYILNTETQKYIIQKMNGLQLPQYDEMVKWFDDPKNIAKWFEGDRIKKTHFKSTNEAADIFFKSFKLTKSLKDENKELYILMNKANKNQLSEILEPEHLKLYNAIYKPQKH